MRFRLKSIHSQVLISFLFIIFINLIISTAIEYHTYMSELPGLLTEIRTRAIAQHLSATYTKNNSWENIDLEIQRLLNLESLNTLEDTSMRIIVRDLTGSTVYNSFSNITSLKNTSLTEGESEEIYNYTNSLPVGVVTLYISRSYLMKYAAGYTAALLRAGFLKGLIIAAVAVIISLLLSRRITRPIISLTSAAELIAASGEASRIEIKSSDEIGQLGRTFNSMIDALQTQKFLRKKLLTDVSHEINTPAKHNQA